ncbi:asparagine synthase (glutamine-hydrolyzing) [Chrysiogenes arsenatis]|uniref:asparagine synthase (glutamine-hydrolyzing) n=1 Tax=Chrysiogenes arsenatis TaxID=309797 RepID=UPI0003FBE7B1|nr:asparagine synthase (glutamine-hydrolyzing) [Chrysiogenes arsenatis]
MCGITGIFDRHQRERIDANALRAMTSALLHRGPDDVGFHQEKNLGLGFRRLAIVDLVGGNQPLYNEDRSLVLICNGEIFNFRELRAGLEQRGHRFTTNTDVEVILHLYEEEGVAFIPRLNGQFAFALYDTTQRRVLLARDHVGIAPLFYTDQDGLFLFASEIKGLLQHPSVKREVDLTGLDQVFAFPGCLAPRTMFRHIRSLQAGHYMLVGKDGMSEHQYWDMHYPREREIAYQDENHYLERLDEALQNAVKLRLLGDVPVGYYLSGGLDSSMIAGILHTLIPDERRHSFSIGFTQPEIDETHFQRMMAAHVGSIHHESRFDWPQISEGFRTMIRHAESPLRESYDTCSIALSRAVREAGMKVVLIGEGADELFAGYYGYKFDRQRQELGDDDPFDPEALLEKELRQELWGDESFIYEKNLYQFQGVREALYSSRALEQFHEFNAVRAGVVDTRKLVGRHPVHRRAYIDLKLRLASHLLSDHGDRAAFANSVEARYPFLDINVLNLVREIPPDLKLHGLTEKYLLKRLGERYIPAPIRERQKFGFVAPGSPYLLGQSLEWVQDTLSRSTIERQGFFNPDVVERLIAQYRSPGFQLNVPYEDDLLMIVLSFGIFMDEFAMPAL